MADLLLAVDIGGSKLLTGLVDSTGRVVAEQRTEWRELTADAVVDTIVGASHALLAEHGVRPAGIGATIPGLADPCHGYWVEASFSGIRDLPIASLLHAEFGVPTWIDNDGQACALAERMFGACQDVTDFLYVTVSNGVGGALFINDGLYYGANGNAGEIGHSVVEEVVGRPCKCGGTGCLEMHASGRAIPLNYEALGGQPGRTALEIGALARVGEPTAVETFALEGYYLGKAIASAGNLLNPARVVIGGSVCLAFDLFERSLQDALGRFIYDSANPDLQVVPSAFGPRGGLVGAAAVAVAGARGLHNYAGARKDYAHR